MFWSDRLFFFLWLRQHLKWFSVWAGNVHYHSVSVGTGKGQVRWEGSHEGWIFLFLNSPVFFFPSLLWGVFHTYSASLLNFVTTHFRNNYFLGIFKMKEHSLSFWKNKQCDFSNCHFPSLSSSFSFFFQSLLTSSFYMPYERATCWKYEWARQGPKP